jgi:Hemocyanin, copper containing domain/Hemocyanin, ig-like domain
MNLSEVQDRSRRVFTELLREGGRAPAAAARPTTPAATAAARGEEAAPVPVRFSVFDPAQAAAASELALGLSVVAAASSDLAEGLDAALTQATQAAQTQDPELVHHALSLFVTHSREGRRLVKPRTVAAEPGKFPPSALAAEGAAAALEAAAAGSTGAERPLDFWREDPLANEHHEHWHEVYPFSGLFPSDWQQWAASADRQGLRELLERLDPATDWVAFLASSDADAIADAFLRRASAVFQQGQQAWRRFTDSLSARAFGTLFHLNDRQGELFFYMHQQMLARYNTERLAHALAPVAPLSDLTAPIDEGYDPGPALERFDGFRERLPGRTLARADAAQLDTWRTAILTAIADRQFLGPTGPVAITRTNIGENVEGTVARLRPQMDRDTYRGLHNFGHNFISSRSEPNDQGQRLGVMATTRTAIRDPVFWRWHKEIDELNYRWQQTQDPYDLASDAPAVLLRHSLAGAAEPWASPDLILCRTAELPGSDAPDFLQGGGQRLGDAAFGGDRWDLDFTQAEVALPDGTSFHTTAELTTTVKQRELVIDPPPGQPGPPWRGTIDYLTHEPFCWFLRVENPGQQDVSVTVRLFLAPEEVPGDAAEERRWWIELDKFIQQVPAGRRVVIFRPDELSSVIKKPADKDPATLPPPRPGDDDDGGSYCQCGWPYTLLLPQGTPAGMGFRLLVLLTDAARDQVPEPGHCGSMSYCGAADRYPDARDMGYPFSRPFTKPIGETFLALDNAAGRRLTIRRT